MTSVRRIAIGIVVVVGSVLFSSSAYANQTIVGAIGSDDTLTYTDAVDVDASIYTQFEATIAQFGVAKVPQHFISSSDHQVTLTGDSLLIPLKHSSKIDTIHLTFSVDPAFHTPVFVGYDVSPYLGSYLSTTNPITITYPASLTFVGSTPRAQAGGASVALSYPQGDLYGPAALNFIASTTPAGYTRDEIGRFVAIVPDADAPFIASALKKLDPLMPQLFSGVFGLSLPDRVYIVEDNLSGKTGFFVDAGGYMRAPNVIVLDKTALIKMEGDELSLEKMLVHEMTHMVVSPVVFSGQEEGAQWFNEGVAVFMENYVADTYLGETPYRVVTTAAGKQELVLDLNDRLTPATVTARYAMPFEYQLPANASSNEIDLFYAHAGLVFYNYFRTTPKGTMKALIDALAPLPSSGTCFSCDDVKILDTMARISGQSRDAILFPYRNDAARDKKLSPIIKSEYTQAQVNTIVAAYEADTLPMSDSLVAKPFGNIWKFVLSSF
jgi:hypothetical protein